MTPSRPTLPDSPAQWIALAGTREARNLYLQFARRFTAAEGEAVSVELSAYSHYRLWVNGRFIGRGPAVGYRTRCYYHRYAIPQDILQGGGNLIAVEVFHEGPTQTVQGFDYGLCGLLAQVDGAGVVTDASWRVRLAPEHSPLASLFSNWGGYKEYYHQERADAWRERDYDHGAWAQAEERGPATDPAYAETLVPLSVPELEKTELQPAEVVDLAQNRGRIVATGGAAAPCPYADGVWTFSPGESYAAPSITLDFGDMTVGYPEVAVHAEGRCVIEVWYGETLDLWRADVLNLSGAATWNAAQRRGCRFMKLVFAGMDGPVRLERVRQHNEWYAYDPRGVTQSSDPQMNRILDVSRHTLRCNTSHHYEDCPIREMALWVMDMRLMGLLNTYLYGNPELNAKCLRQAFAIQRDSGHIASTGPKDNRMYHLDFIMHLVATLRDHFRHTGDRDIVEELWPRCLRALEWIRNYQDADGLLDSELHEPSGLFLDWSESIEKAGKATILNALFVELLENLAELADRIGADGADGWRAEAASLRGTIHGALFSPTDGVYRDTIRKGELLPTISQQANMAALFSGIAPEDTVAGIMEKVWDSDAYPRPFGPSYYLVVFDALARLGRYDAMVDVIRSYWGEMLDRGATTWWEVFNPETPKWAYPHPFLGNTPTHEMDWIPISACHGWSGAPGYVIPRDLLGIRLEGLWEKRVAIRPGLPGFFERFDYAVPAAGGMLRVAFRRDGEGYAIDVQEAPEGIEVVVEQ